MTEEKDGPVHYQVSVTGRQAAAFFLGLLAALGLSFFFGMKTGAAAKKGQNSVTALAAQSDIQVRAPESDGERVDGATPVPTEVPIGFDAAPTEASRQPAPRAEAPATREPKAAARQERPIPAEEPKIVELAPTPVATLAEKAAPAPAPVKTAAPAKEADGPFWVQIVVTSNAEKADDLAKKLKADGFKPVVSPVTGKKGLTFRVRVGPYPDRAKAEAAATKVQKAEKLDTKPIVVPGT
ncbi:MAG: SPOR domain-containing protein [Holophagales bacterium]|nr:SPOR domain-containing protein [Holophagales bacterium]